MTTLKKNKKITSKEFDKKFNAGDDMGDFLNLKKVKVNKHLKRINIDIPVSILAQIDDEANKIGVPRTSIIKVWIAERLEHIQHYEVQHG